jgi:hypothetical protein
MIFHAQKPEPENFFMYAMAVFHKKNGVKRGFYKLS